MYTFGMYWPSVCVCVCVGIGYLRLINQLTPTRPFISILLLLCTSREAQENFFPSSSSCLVSMPAMAKDSKMFKFKIDRRDLLEGKVGAWNGRKWICEKFDVLIINDLPSLPEKPSRSCSFHNFGLAKLLINLHS